MNKPIPIHWRDLGQFRLHKFNRKLHANMLSSHKVQMLLQVSKEIPSTKNIYLVEYDKEYVLEWLVRKVLVPFALLEEEEVINLIREAYNYEQK